MSGAPRKQAPRIARPAARYWKGKAPKGVAALPSDSDDSDADDAPRAQAQEAGDVAFSGEQTLGGSDDDEEDDGGVRVKAQGKGKGRAMNVALRDVNISRDGKVIVAGREESGRTAVENEDEEEDSDEEEDEEAAPGQKVASDDESSEYDSSSEEEEKPKLQFRPVFVPKRARATVAEKEALAQDTEEALKRKEAEAEERKRQSHDMVAESIKRELAEKEKDEEVPDVDDADGADAAGEFDAWRLRELARIRRDKADALAREEERAEVERRRALPEAQRLAEDVAHAEKSRAEKPKGQQKFLQKYWHKGAFRQDEEILTRHDYTEATASTVDVSMLPKVMQVKNFGKRSRTKYTHLLDQDTTGGNGGFGGVGGVKAGGTSTGQGGCFVCGGPHLKKDCPQNQDLPPGQRPVTGANGVLGGARQWGEGRRDSGGTGRADGSWRDRDDHVDARERDRRDHERPREDDGRRGGGYDYDRDRRNREYGGGGGRQRSPALDYGRRGSRSRSRSPPRRERRKDDERRRHSRSRSGERGGEKRRRLD